ncbi:WhiB family transcriptional regulator [Saccharothrix sp. HUAS TT1]|uniref:WhiB family transcriptional regulator n=1 Tax=unclassified Saccharothrix TaxID=2593673 RepID=UPI00345C1BDC
MTSAVDGKVPVKSDTPTIPLSVHEDICRVFDLLRNTSGPRAAQAPGLAERHGWYTPQQWELAYIDNPASTPDAIVGEIDLSRGLCRTHRDPDLWAGLDTSRTAAAKRICRGCPVQRDCLTLALVKPEKWNTWGGVGEGTRDPIQRRLVKATAGRALLGSPELEEVLDRYCGPARTAGDPADDVDTPVPAPRSAAPKAARTRARVGGSGASAA